ncbi:MAG: tetratricopeptide repeat protein [Candidatus Hydrothermales bacterium]
MKEEFKEIEELYQKWENEGKKSKTFAALADAYRKRKMYDEALAVLEEGLKFHPDYSVAYYIKAKIHLERNELELARINLNKLVELDESHVVGLRLLAETCEKLGKEQEALLAYKKLYDLDPLTSEVEDKIKELEEKLIKLSSEEDRLGEKEEKAPTFLTSFDEPLLDILEDKDIISPQVELPEIPEEAKEILREIENEQEEKEEIKLKEFKFVEDVLEKKTEGEFISLEEFNKEEPGIKVEEESLIEKDIYEEKELLEGGEEEKDKDILLEESLFGEIEEELISKSIETAKFLTEDFEDIIKSEDVKDIKGVFEEKEVMLSGHPSKFMEELKVQEKEEGKEEELIIEEREPLSLGEIIREPERPSESIEEIFVEKSAEKIDFVKLMEKEKEEVIKLDEKVEEKQEFEERKEEEKGFIEIPEEVKELFEDLERAKEEKTSEEQTRKEITEDEKITEKNYRSFVEWINFLKRSS